MSISSVIRARGLKEVVHFTTNHGCLGTLASGALKSRARLQKDDLLEFIFQPNAEIRKDLAHLDYVNLSISHINYEFFAICSRWHSQKDIFWCILSFDPNVLEDEGVIFTTTNNIYTGVRRATGEGGLEAMFAPKVVRWSGNVASRAPLLSGDHATCHQAEVLYPGELKSSLIKRIYVRQNSEASEIAGFIKALFHPKIELVVAPEKFQPRP